MAGQAWRRSNGMLARHAVFSTVLLWLGFRNAAAQDAGSILDAVSKNANLTVLSSAIRTAGLDGMLGDPNLQVTLFAPSDTAWRNGFAYGSQPCTTNYFQSNACSSTGQFLQATDLSYILSNLVVMGSFPTSSLTNGTRLLMMGNKVQQVVVRGNLTWLGSTSIVVPDVKAGRGFLHILSSIPISDVSVNETSITAASNLGNFGPFNLNKRTQMVNPTAAAPPTSIPSLIAGYQRVRTSVELPQGGLINPMSISYNPVSMYRLLRAMPSGGIYDSEASLSPQPSPALTSSYAPPPGNKITIAEGPSQLQTRGLSPTASLATARAQASQVDLPGFAENGVTTDLCAPAANASWQWQLPQGLQRPSSNDSLAQLTVLELAALIESRQVTSMELVEIFTARLKKYDYVLEAVVTYTTELAREQAASADQLISQGTYLGPLHGIPYGLKDIIAVKGYPTTWGAPQFRNQHIEENAHVYSKLQAAGAVLIAKLATGEMAYDDVWWGGKTKNPWNIAQGSSGSSAGPAASVAAATVPFSIGTETEGSLMSPSATCGVTAMRPSLGSVGRSWVMKLADSLDKLGPICRSVADCAVIFDVIRGRDDLDPTSRDANLFDPFEVDISQLTVGYVAGMETNAPEVLRVLREKGVTLKPFSLSYDASAEDIIMTIMISEAAAHFDYWQRSGMDDQNRRQDYWPPLLRLARLIPAVEYIQSQRARSVLAVEVLGSMKAAGIDAFLANTTTELAMSNLVGLPTVSVPIGFNRADGAAGSSNRRSPVTVGFFGWPSGEPEVLALGMAWQNETSYHREAPPIDKVEPAVLSQCIPFSRCTLPPGLLSATPPSISISTLSPSPKQSVADSG